MEDYILEGKNDKPFFRLLLTGNFEMGGVSLPENVLDIFDPFSKWLNEYFINYNQPTQIDMYFEYLNTASSRILMKTIQDMNQMSENNDEVTIRWHFQTGDYDMKDFGMELQDESKCKFELVENPRLADIVSQNIVD